MKKTALIATFFVIMPLVLSGCGVLDKTLDYLAKEQSEARQERSRQEQLQFEQSLHASEIQRMKSYYKEGLSSLPQTEKLDLLDTIVVVDNQNLQSKNYWDPVFQIKDGDMVNIKKLWFQTYSSTHVWMNVTFWPYNIRLDYAFDLKNGEITRITGLMWGGSHILIYDEKGPRNDEPFVPLTQTDQEWVKRLGNHFFFEYAKIRGKELKNRMSILSQ